MDKDIINKIFDPFFYTKPKGNGMGLTMVYSIVKKNNGEIFIESQQNKYTKFEIILPYKNGIKIINTNSSNFSAIIKNKKNSINNSYNNIKNFNIHFILKYILFKII